MTTKERHTIGVLASVYAFLAGAAPVSADPVNDVIQKYLPAFDSFGVCAAGDIPDITGIFCILVRLISVLLASVGGVALIILMLGGLRYMASGGDEKAITSAKAAITYAVLGLIITIGAVFAVNQILTLLMVK